MKKILSKKLVLFVIAILIIVIGFTGWVVLFRNPPEPDSANTKTLNQGQQMHYNEINIALANIEGNSGWLYIHKENDTGEPFKKLVTAGDKFDVYGYTIEVKSVKSVINLIPLPGRSNGYIKFIINKK